MSPSPACELAKQAGWWYTIDIVVYILSLSPTGYFCQQRQGDIPRPGAGLLETKGFKTSCALCPVVIGSLYHTVTGFLFCRADKRTVSASAPLPLISAMVEAGASTFQSKNGSEKRSRDSAAFR